MNGLNQPTLVKCISCGRSDTVTVRYSCPANTHYEIIGPKPNGMPALRPCPPDTLCGGNEQGVAIACNNCSAYALVAR